MRSRSRINLNIYKYILINIAYILMSFFISAILLIIGYLTLNKLYIREISQTLNYLIDSFLIIKRNLTGDIIYIIIYILLSILVYMIITYRKYKRILDLVETVDLMASGNLDKKIDIKSNGIVGKVGKDINKIVEQLRNITVEERQAQQTKTDLITNVSHDLRTPLTSILGYLNLIEDDKYKDEVELRYYINIAYEKAQSLKILIDDLFELTKMQNNTQMLNKVDINLNELIGQIVSHLGYQLKSSNMEVRINFCKDDVMINADPLKLVRAFENLIVNAIKYGKDGVYVDININKDINKNTIEVSIINYGEPIPVVDLPYIFDRFYRVEKSRNRNEAGSGLGLAITKHIIENHHGSISVDSDNEKTTFKVLFNTK